MDIAAQVAEEFEGLSVPDADELPYRRTLRVWAEQDFWAAQWYKDAGETDAAGYYGW